jgi:hypothetical protein
VCQQLVEGIIDQVVEVLGICNVDCPEVHSLLEECRNPFENLETEYAQTAFMESLGVFIEPETYVVGNRQTFVTDTVTKFSKPVMEAETGQYVSISKTIMALNTKTASASRHNQSDELDGIEVSEENGLGGSHAPGNVGIPSASIQGNKL